MGRRPTRQRNGILNAACCCSLVLRRRRRRATKKETLLYVLMASGRLRLIRPSSTDLYLYRRQRSSTTGICTHSRSPHLPPRPQACRHSERDASHFLFCTYIYFAYIYCMCVRVQKYINNKPLQRTCVSRFPNSFSSTPRGAFLRQLSCRCHCRCFLSLFG